MADVGGAGEGLLEWVRFEVKVRASLSGRRLKVGGGRYIDVFGRSSGHNEVYDGDDDSTT